MLRNYFVINLVLVIIIGLLGVRLYRVLAYSVEIPLEAEKKEALKEEVDFRRGGREINYAAFEKISRLDLFRPSRSAPLTTNTGTNISMGKNPPKLFGTIILDNDRTAILEDPDTKTTKVYRINDSIAGFTVSEILKDKVVLVSGGKKIEVRLRDDKGIKPARKTIRSTARRQIQNRKSVTPRRSRPVTPRRRPRRVNPAVNQNIDSQNIDNLNPGGVQ